MKTNYHTNFRKASRKLWGILCLGFLVSFSSCKKENEGGTHFALKDNPTAMTVTSQGSSQTFTVQSAGVWKVEPLRNERWVKIEPREGNGEGTFTVTVDRNTTPEPRQSTLTFVVDGKIQNNVLKIEQEAHSQEGEDDDPYVNLDGLESLEVPEAGLHGRYAMRSTGNWKIEIPEGADWLSIEPMEGRFDTGVTIDVDINTTPESRTAGLVFYLDGEQVPGIFNVNQGGMEVILYEDFNWLGYGSAIFYTTSGETRIDKWSADELARGWGWYNPSADGIPSTYARQGFVKLGKTNYGSDIRSPKLAEVQGIQNLQVTFKAVPYETAGGTRDGTALKVGVIGPGTVSVAEFTIDNWPDYTADPNCTEIWKYPETTRSFTITGATAETQIWFLGGDYDLREAAPNKNRIFLDDILVSVLK
ncbi:BACON domain-containing protein [Parapedobacter tibetensis]|uniref:BACON domain-containing protein n=1 Tax=Parapedobacter tibetensis TaxID=2972951 RepID=UPI00214D4B61|nr:BACON domain-containing protein [Parapedobacter tibetensis]